MSWILLAIFLVVAAVVIAVAVSVRFVAAGLDLGDFDRRKLQLDTIKALAEMMGGILLLAALVFAWQELRSTQEQLEVARQGQVTERFTRAVEQLANPDASVRMGGIFALESIARDSPADHPAVFEVLASFLRQNSPVDGALDERDWMAWRSARPASDIEAAAIAIGRRDLGNEPDLTGSCNRLGGPNFPCALNLRQVDLSGIDLSVMDLDQVDLSGAALNFTNLGFTSMQRTDLSFADLRGANLRLADVTDATLTFSRVELANMHLVEGLTCQQLESTHDGGAGAANLTINCPQ